MNQSTAELGTTIPINGFPRLADKIASDKYKTTTIYRRFDQLSARNLILLEAEIAELEFLQNKYDREDRYTRDEAAIGSYTDWRKFEQNGTMRDDDDKFTYPKEAQKMELAMRIRAKLKEYHESLIAHQTLLNSKPPANTTVSAMRNWFWNKRDGKADGAPKVFGASEARFDDVYDLVALRVPADQDRLSEFVVNNFGVLFITETPDGQSTYISERSVARFVAILSSILSAILIFGSITSLYFVHNPYALLGMLGSWTVLFAVVVGWVTSARRDQIFAATAAYAAVLVVFVSGTLGGASPNMTPP
ncbi:hypothetical protein PVAG01_09816 [Phlyctema vagabunda]|uniref:DUF6594 domain-containing protein n=1 Tax=Phlyctema vagabunda TaxID=108571 RepID=A0ABR4P4S8_9HELO